jgi:hypothetical protein
VASLNGKAVFLQPPTLYRQGRHLVAGRGLSVGRRARPFCAIPNKGRVAASECAAMFDRVVDVILIFGFPLGVLVGYAWRDRISRARRARYLAERNRAARNG